MLLAGQIVRSYLSESIHQIWTTQLRLHSKILSISKLHIHLQKNQIEMLGEHLHLSGSAIKNHSGN